MSPLSPLSSDPWCIHLPYLHRALSDRGTVNSLPHANTLDDLSACCAYWECVYYSLDALLGWKDQAKGLHHWYRLGKPVNDSPVLALLKTHWDHDGLLDYYAAWAWNPGAYVSDPEDLSPTAIGAKSTFADEAWWRAFKRRGKMMKHDPFYGGSNPLHLGHSERFGIVEKQTPHGTLYLAQGQALQAVLVVESISGWRTELARCESALPVSQGRSWRIKVFDTCAGFLGEFRQSRETGLWFTGKHSVHIMGN